MQGPTQNLPEIQQQRSFSIQHIFHAVSSCAPLRPHVVDRPKTLRTPGDVLTSLSLPAVGWQPVRCARVQEIIAGATEGISRHGQTGRGPLTGWGETLCRVNGRKESNQTWPSAFRRSLLLWRPAFACLVMVGSKTLKDVIDKSHNGCR